MKFKPPLFLCFLFLLPLLSVVTLSIGDTPWEILWRGFQERLAGVHSLWNPLLDERLPRVIVLICTGASLSVAGAVTQSIFQNPLASPSTLGISAGSNLCVLLGFILGWHISTPFALPFAAFLGSLTTLFLVYAFARHTGNFSTHNLILSGIALTTVILAIQRGLLYALRDNWSLIQTLTEWESGSTVDLSWSHVHMQLPLALVGLVGCLSYSKELNLLALGEEDACNLGVDVASVQRHLFLCIALLTGGACSTIGNVPFFGFVLPHIMRKILGPDNRQLLSYCALAGSVVLIALDLLLRIFHLHALSIGSLSAALGGSFFLFLLFVSPHSKRVLN